MTTPPADRPPVVVTGASGWLGRAALDVVLRGGGTVQAFASEPKEIQLRDGRRVGALALRDLPRALEPGSLVLHLAYLTREREADLGAAEYGRQNHAISATVLEAVEQAPPSALFYASSGAAYNAGADLYGRLKLEDEQAFAAACERSILARVFALSGPYMTKPRSYALGDLICSALAGEPLSIRATGPVVRSYLAAEDLIQIVLAEATGPAASGTTSFDACGTDAVEIGELAERIAALVGDGRVEVTRPPLTGGEDVYHGDPAALQRLAARHGIRLSSLEDQISATAEWLHAAR